MALCLKLRCPHYLFRDKVGKIDKTMALYGIKRGMDFDSGKRDVAYLGSCDDGCVELARLLGWSGELTALHTSEHARLH